MHLLVGHDLGLGPLLQMKTVKKRRLVEEKEAQEAGLDLLWNIKPQNTAAPS